MKYANFKFSFVFYLNVLCILKINSGNSKQCRKTLWTWELILIAAIMTYIWATNIGWSMCKVGHHNCRCANYKEIWLTVKLLLIVFIASTVCMDWWNEYMDDLLFYIEPQSFNLAKFSKASENKIRFLKISLEQMKNSNYQCGGLHSTIILHFWSSFKVALFGILYLGYIYKSWYPG